MKATPALKQGLVVASYGKRYGVELIDPSSQQTRSLSCVTRGKKTDLACGDIVNIKLTDTNEAVIESFNPRSTLLYRSNAYRSKLLAANVTQMVIVLATTPSFYEELLNRCLIASEAAGVTPLILLNKCDVAADKESAMQRLALYSTLGYQVLPLSAKTDISPLKPLLEGHTSVLVGQSGMGKSTITNALLPELGIRTQEVSMVLDSGKHTTTAAHLYHLNANSQLIDSPGLQEFGLNHLDIEALEHAFIEFRPYLGKCRFNNCRHIKEPDCALSQAVVDGSVSSERLKYYQALTHEIGRQP